MEKSEVVYRMVKAQLESALRAEEDREGVLNRMLTDVQHFLPGRVIKEAWDFLVAVMGIIVDGELEFRDLTERYDVALAEATRLAESLADAQEEADEARAVATELAI